MRKNFYGRGNDAFVCENCGGIVHRLVSGGYRNHCPMCLYSKHVDVIPGDRLENCNGLMEPIGVEYDSKRGWILVHKCLECGFVRRNKIASNDQQKDNWDLICHLSAN